MSGLPNSPAKCLLQRHDPALYEAELGGASELTLHANNNHSSETQPAAHSEPKMGISRHDQDQDQDRPLVLTEYEAIYHIHSQPSDKTPIVLTFGPHDVDDPRNWSKARKWYITCLVSMLNVLTCLCAGGYSSGSHLLKEEFHCSSTMATLGLSNYILGFAFGPMLLAPLSEHWGRNPIYIWSWLLLVILQVPAALAGSISTLVGIRFLQGLAGSAPLTNTGGTIADLWERHSSGAPMAIYGLSSTLGPPLALPLTGYLAEVKGWRFLFWFFMAVFGFTWLVLILTLPETRHPVILAQKRHRLQKQMKAAGYKAVANIKSAIARDDLAILFKHTLTRPIRFLFTEPITFSTALYNGLIYGLVFLFNESFPLVFGHLHNFSHAQTSLTFLGLCIGSLIGAALHPLQERHYAKVQTPEARVWLSLPGCFLLPISLFWFAACSVASVPWIIPVIASVLFGTGIFIVVLGVLNFVLDSYGHYTASALAGVILVRNIVGAIFPLFAENMYEGMGYRYAGVLLGFLALCFCVVPFGFYYFGVEIRRRSKYARRSQDAAHNTVV